MHLLPVLTDIINENVFHKVIRAYENNYIIYTYMYAKEFYSFILKKNEISLLTGKCVELDIIQFSKISPA